MIAGESHGVSGAVQNATRPSRSIWTFTSTPVAHVSSRRCRPRTTAFVYVYRGEVAIDGGGSVTSVPRERMAVLANRPEADGVRLRAGELGARALLVAGRPLGEPIAQYGPFVMNSQAERSSRPSRTSAPAGSASPRAADAPTPRPEQSARA